MYALVIRANGGFCAVEEDDPSIATFKTAGEALDFGGVLVANAGDGTCMCDACQNVAHLERDILAGLTPEQQLHVYNLVEQCGWDIDKALALYR